MSEIRVDAIKTRAGAVPTANDVGLNISGSVIQFKHVNFTNNVAVSSSTFTDITGGTITITPQFSTSKIFVLI